MRQLLQTLFQYQTWATDDLLSLLGRQGSLLSMDDMNASLRILNHCWVVEQIFQANLQGLPHGRDALNTPETPSLETLQTRLQASAAWYQHYLQTLDTAAWQERLDFLFVDGKAGNMQRSEMLMHLLTHGNYHRGMVGRILAAAGIQPPKDSLTAFLHATP